MSATAEPQSAPQASTPTPYEQLGGEPVVAALAQRFYQIMAERPEASGIRAMHADDLSKVTGSLTEFLRGWLGGPRDWFMRGDRPCIMSLHRRLPIGEAERDQWLACMAQAADETVERAELRPLLMDAFARMAEAMRSR